MNDTPLNKTIGVIRLMQIIAQVRTAYIGDVDANDALDQIVSAVEKDGRELTGELYRGFYIRESWNGRFWAEKNARRAFDGFYDLDSIKKAIDAKICG